MERQEDQLKTSGKGLSQSDVRLNRDREVETKGQRTWVTTLQRLECKECGVDLRQRVQVRRGICSEDTWRRRKKKASLQLSACSEPGCVWFDLYTNPIN